jgi:hypothetical protein
MLARIGIAAMVLIMVAIPALAAPKKADVKPLVDKLKKDKNAAGRAEAAKELGHIGTVKSAWLQEFVADIAAAIKDPDVNVRREVAITLGEIKADPKVAVPALASVLKDADGGVKAAAAESLGYFGVNAKDALPALKELQAELGKLSKEDQQKNGNLIQAVNQAVQVISQAK